ncbi:hypothetical protein BDP81DRAFT_412364, partial [Colletotrichum phormii]
RILHGCKEHPCPRVVLCDASAASWRPSALVMLRIRWVSLSQLDAATLLSLYRLDQHEVAARESLTELNGFDRGLLMPQSRCISRSRLRSRLT